MANPSNAGPFKIGLDSTLAAGASTTIRFEEVETGPKNQQGYLKKIYGKKGGIDYVYAINASGELISVEVKGDSTFVPSATSQSLDGGSFRFVKVTNQGSTTINQDSSDAIKIIVGNNERSTDDSFSLTEAVNDTIPGATL